MKGVIRYSRAHSKMFKANTVQVHIPKCGLAWQITWFFRGATVSAKDFPGSSCHLVVTQDICLIFSL